MNNNSKMDKELNNKYIDSIYFTNVANTINVNDKENENPNKISLNNHRIYKSKNNLGKLYNITLNYLDKFK